MEADKQKELRELSRYWALSDNEKITEEQLIDLLSLRLGRMLERDPEAFFQAMYRLDISEERLIAALTDANQSVALARLVWQRQWEKATARSTFPQTPPDDDELRW